MPVVINEMDSTVEMEGEQRGQASAPAAPPPASAAPLDDADFRERYGPLLRAMIRDELERYLRNAAD